MQTNFIANEAVASVSARTLDVLDPSDGRVFDQLQRSDARDVEAAVHACLRDPSSNAVMYVVVRRDAGPLEFLIDGRTVAVEP